MDVRQITKIAFTSEDRVRAVMHTFNADGFDSLATKHQGGRSPTFTKHERFATKKIALSRRPTASSFPPGCSLRELVMRANVA